MEQKKASMIKNTISNIKVFNTNVKPLFLAKDIGILMGISHINMLVKKFDKESISGYTVPYHVHNDFLEVATELGLLGVFFYISIFGSFLFILFKLFVLDSNNRFFYFTLFF